MGDTTLLVLALSLLLQLGALLAGARQVFRFREYVRVFSYASAAYLLLIIPREPGVILAFVVMLVVCGRALRIHHRFSPAQTFIATVPFTKWHRRTTTPRTWRSADSPSTLRAAPVSCAKSSKAQSSM